MTSSSTTTVPTPSAVRIHGLTRSITKLLYDKYHIIITVGIYAVCTSEKGKELQKGIMNFVERYPHVEQIHGYFYLEEKRAISFDVVPDDTIRDTPAIFLASLLTMSITSEP